MLYYLQQLLTIFVSVNFGAGIAVYKNLYFSPLLLEMKLMRVLKVKHNSKAVVCKTITWKMLRRTVQWGDSSLWTLWALCECTVKWLHGVAWLYMEKLNVNSPHTCRCSPWMTLRPCTNSTVRSLMSKKTKCWKIWPSRLRPCVTHLRSTLQSDIASMETLHLLEVVYHWIYLLILLLYVFLSFRGPEETVRLAEEVHQRLIAHKADNPSMGEVRNYCTTSLFLIECFL